MKVMKWTCGGAATSAPRTGGGSTCFTASPSRRLHSLVRRSVCTLWTRSRRGARRSRIQRWRTSPQNARTGTSGGRPSTRRCGRPTRTGRPCSRRSCDHGVAHATAPARWRRRRAAAGFCCLVISLSISLGPVVTVLGLVGGLVWDWASNGAVAAPGRLASEDAVAGLRGT